MSRKNANGAGNIRKRSDGRWEARYSNGFDPKTGKLIQKSVYGKTQKEVRQKLAKITSEIDEGTYIEPNSIKLSEWLTVWLRDYIGNVKPATVKSYADHVKLNIIPYIGAGWRKHAVEDRQAFGYTLGLWNRLRLSRKLALNFEASYGTHELSSKQRALNLEMGFTYSIGKGTWKQSPDLEAVHALYQSEIDALNAQVQDAYAENDELRQQLEQQQELPPPTDNNMTLPVTP